MTRDEILSMEAGEKLDRLVAEKVMGWHPVKERENWTVWYNSENRYQHPVARYDGYSDDEDFHLIFWHPSESILWAWEVIEKLGGKEVQTGYIVELVYEGRWNCKIGNHFAYADEAPLAICRAALLTVTE